MQKYRRTASVSRGHEGVFPATAGAYASTPDSVANSITGDIDLVIRVAMADWTPGVTSYLLTKFEVANQISYLVSITTSGTIQLEWSVLGTIVATAASSVPTGLTDGAFATIRVTLDVDNGAVGHTARFYVDGVELGSAFVGVGITAIFDSSSNVTLSGFANGLAGTMTASVISYAEIRNGIGGPAVNIFDPRSARRGATSWVAATGEVWTINGAASIR